MAYNDEYEINNQFDYDSINDDYDDYDYYNQSDIDNQLQQQLLLPADTLPITVPSNDQSSWDEDEVKAPAAVAQMVLRKPKRIFFKDPIADRKYLSKKRYWNAKKVKLIRENLGEAMRQHFINRMVNCTNDNANRAPDRNGLTLKEFLASVDRQYCGADLMLDLEKIPEKIELATNIVPILSTDSDFKEMVESLFEHHFTLDGLANNSTIYHQNWDKTTTAVLRIFLGLAKYGDIDSGHFTAIYYNIPDRLALKSRLYYITNSDYFCKKMKKQVLGTIERLMEESTTGDIYNTDFVKMLRGFGFNFDLLYYNLSMVEDDQMEERL